MLCSSAIMNFNKKIKFHCRLSQKPVTSVKAVEGMNKDGLILEGGSGQTRGTAYDTP
jgi:hypothetical protein